MRRFWRSCAVETMPSRTSASTKIGSSKTSAQPEEREGGERVVVARPDLSLVEVGVVVRQELAPRREHDPVGEGEARREEDRRDGDEGDDDALRRSSTAGARKLQSCQRSTGSASATAA